MKELSIEEKAKAYDEVREKIAIRFGSNVADEIFSQFEMSEDERIRKEITKFLKKASGGFLDTTTQCKTFGKWAAWVEKQGEQKPNPYTGTSFEYNGHTFGMCAREGGVEISMDSELKAFVSSEKSFVYPIHPQPDLAESEDEKIRKRILFSLQKDIMATKNSGCDTKDLEKCIDWLEKQESVEEIVERCKTSWYNEGKIAGMAEGLSDEEKYQQGWHDALEKQDKPQDKGEISDGYHTFNELYYYRMLYNAAFFNMLPKEWVHKSKRHNDGEECFGGGWFIVMANLPTGQISNHYELKDWDLFQIPEKEVADKWDGHTPQEAADRLHKYLLENQGEQETTYNEEKLNVLNFIRKETCCGLAEANNALLKLIKVLKEHPSPIMDKPSKLKIEWEEQQ
jgi:hypothetical protein